MRATKYSDMSQGALTTKELQSFLSVGYRNAVAFGTAAGAKISIGRSVRWNKAAVQRALDNGLSVTKEASA